jgi:hypothetical protein
MPWGKIAGNASDLRLIVASSWLTDYAFFYRQKKYWEVLEASFPGNGSPS